MADGLETTDELVRTLRAAGCVFAEEEAALLLAAGGSLKELTAQRVAGRPLEQVLGWAGFAGLRLAVRPGVFVPRRRTELLVRLAVAALPDRGVVLDLCCGTGAVGLAVARQVPGVELHAADVDPVAVACARENLAGTGHVHEGDLFDALPVSLRGRVDVLVVNAPYVPSRAVALMPPEARDHEARTALDGGADGLDVHRRVAADVTGWLAPGGVLVIETSTAQADRTAALLPLKARVVHDDELDGTAVVGRRV